MIKFATMGTNWITQQFIDAALETGKYQLCGVYSRKQKTGDDFACQNHCRNVFVHQDEFFSSDQFDVVYIATPNILHKKAAISALKNDKSVIVEKPAFVGPYQLQEVFDTLKQHPKAHLFEAARNVHMPAFKAVKKLVSQKGKPDGASFTFSKYSSRYDLVLKGETPNVFNLNFGGGALQDLGVYPAYAAVAFLGMPKEVKYYPKFIHTGADGGGVAVLSYSDFEITLNFSKISTSYHTSDLYFGKDTVEIDSAGEFTKAWLNGESEKQLSPFYQNNPMIPEALDFAQIINDPDNSQNMADYQRWLSQTKQVNELLADLSASAGISYFK